MEKKFKSEDGKDFHCKAENLGELAKRNKIKVIIEVKRTIKETTGANLGDLLGGGLRKVEESPEKRREQILGRLQKGGAQQLGGDMAAIAAIAQGGQLRKVPQQPSSGNKNAQKSGSDAPVSVQLRKVVPQPSSGSQNAQKSGSDTPVFVQLRKVDPPSNSQTPPSENNSQLEEKPKGNPWGVVLRNIEKNNKK
jgi:hypothetical protein